MCIRMYVCACVQAFVDKKGQWKAENKGKSLLNFPQWSRTKRPTLVLYRYNRCCCSCCFLFAYFLFVSLHPLCRFMFSIYSLKANSEFCLLVCTFVCIFVYMYVRLCVCLIVSETVISFARLSNAHTQPNATSVVSNHAQQSVSHPLRPFSLWFHDR